MGISGKQKVAQEDDVVTSVMELARSSAAMLRRA
jgi:hypothetical protein